MGGLLSYEIGRVPLPGARVEAHGLILVAEGGTDARGRVRVSTVLVEKSPEPESGDDSTDDDRDENDDDRR